MWHTGIHIQYVLIKLSMHARLETSLHHNSFNNMQTPFFFLWVGFLFCVCGGGTLIGLPYVWSSRSQEFEMMRGSLELNLGRDIAWTKDCLFPGFHDSLLQSQENWGWSVCNFKKRKKKEECWYDCLMLAFNAVKPNLSLYLSFRCPCKLFYVYSIIF